MDAKAKTNTILKNVQDSVREWGHLSLQMASKAVAFTATHLSTLKDEMEKTAAKLKPESVAKDETTPEQPKQ